MSSPLRMEQSNIALLRKVLLTSSSGLITFGGSAALDSLLHVSLAEQLILSVVVGGITLLVQFLIEFEQRLKEVEVTADRRLDRMEGHQREVAAEMRAAIDRHFARINEATAFFRRMEASAVQTDTLKELVQRAALINGGRAQLIRDLAHHELLRVSALLKSLADGTEVFYDGEDREWLLGLASTAQNSIAATSLATVDADLNGFEGGLWMNDLGDRYLDLQRTAIRERDVTVRRIFVFDTPDYVMDSDFVLVRALQREAGVQVRVLAMSEIPEHLRSLIFDFVVFDDAVSYETTPATRSQRGSAPYPLTTRLLLDPPRVHQRVARFEELWRAARDTVGEPEGRPAQSGST